MVEALDAVTGAFSYSGSAVAAALRRRGRAVRTLTNHPAQDAHGIDVRPLDLRDDAGLRRSLTGIDTLYNTYWVRFPHRQVTFETAIDGSARLFRAAADAGVRRIVHISITGADVSSPYAYFRGKGIVEQHLKECRVSYAIARPAILFGGDGVLINNIAWLMRRSPLTLVGGGGQYRLRGIHIDDLADLMAELGASDTDTTVDAVGPESLTFMELLEHIRTSVESRTRIVPIPGRLFPVVTWMLGQALRDTLLTREEYLAMADGLADSSAPATGTIRLTEWITQNRGTLGRTYAHELRRHYETPPHGPVTATFDHT
ncbi:NAD-dependent epimerase/dehydratase family protein [Nocardioides sp. CER19]|uniref:NAD-dependent epimerase/dehydratase family protein n=1 Tax=Nocardioides sp. CER19 TaxID=3038538 RepID=UPI00244B3AEC|nr:NAD-dependent epimerase/dehydratase family protein [Nocardioides sp. CER19]MDH2415425.1 NAD-dependent epimerase/dehydratase family protein [Nocardioides sp. CER19]